MFCYGLNSPIPHFPNSPIPQFLNSPRRSDASLSCRWDNVIITVELLQPNKSDALPYLDSYAPAPARYAKATLQFGATAEPYIQEYMVGPLPVVAGKTSYAELSYIYTSGSGRSRVYNADAASVQAFNLKVGAGIADITRDLLNGVSQTP